MIRLHHSPQTRSMRVLWLLHEIGEPFDLVEYSFDGAIKTPEYLTKNPAGRVPTLEIGSDVIFESGAAIELLCERYAPDTLGRGLNHPERVAWLTWVHFAETISQHVAALTQQHIAIFEDWMRSPIVMKLEAKRLAKTFGAVENALEERHDWLLPSGFSAADVAVGQAVYMGRHFVDLSPFPKVTRWMGQIETRPAFQASLPKGRGLYTKRFYAPWPIVAPDG